MWSSLPRFCTFCCSAIPTSCSLLLVYLAASACLSWGLPSHSSSSLFSQVAYIDQYYLPNQASIQTLRQFFSDKASSPSLKTGSTHSSRHSKIWIILHIFIHIYHRDLSQSFKVPHSIDKTTHTADFELMPRYMTWCAPTVFLLIQRFWVLILCCC